MNACVAPAVTIALPYVKNDTMMFRMQRSKSRTSLLADLIAPDDNFENTANRADHDDFPGIILPLSWKEGDPKAMLRDLLGDFFIDAEDLEIKELLGEGGFAVVHRCLYYDPVKKERISVAMKELKPDLIQSVEDLREFVMEASIQRKLRHNNIVRILGIGARDYRSMDSMRRSMFILQEYVSGKSLKEMVIGQMCNRSVHLYSMKCAVGWLLDIAGALHYLHEVCRPMIVHRDLKLDNILLSHHGKSAKLCDFGLHKRIRTQGISPVDVDTPDESYYGGILYQSLMDRVQEETSSYDSGDQISSDKEASILRDLTLSKQLSLGTDVLRISQSLRGLSSIDPDDLAGATTYSERPAHDQKLGFTGKVGSIVYMAPEVFLNKSYNEKVDVFSFAVMMYETLAQTNIMVKHGLMGERGALSGYAEKVANGFREEIPRHWPQYVKMLISECWDENPRNRPTFKDIIHRLTFIYNSGIAEKMERPLIGMNFSVLNCCCLQ